MGVDGYSLFTECHLLYMQGIRRALRERLESVFGGEWFQRGVLPAMSDFQRETLENELGHWPDPDYANLLDVAHFSRIVRRNHAAAFTKELPELDLVLGQFDQLRAIRNDWAHVVPDSLPLRRAASAAQLMKELLLKLHCPEAVQIQSLLAANNLTNMEGPIVESASDGGRSDDYQDDRGSTEQMRHPAALWQTLQGYLVSETQVEPMEELAGTRAVPERQVRVTVRVSNIAPASEDMPEICFENVQLSVLSARNRQQSDLGSLAPGQTVERQFEVLENAVTQFECHVQGKVDHRKYFSVQRKNGLPLEVVRPVIDRFAGGFDAIGIKEPFNRALKAIADVRASIYARCAVASLPIDNTRTPVLLSIQSAQGRANPCVSFATQLRRDHHEKQACGSTKIVAVQTRPLAVLAEKIATKTFASATNSLPLLIGNNSLREVRPRP